MNTVFGFLSASLLAIRLHKFAGLGHRNSFPFCRLARHGFFVFVILTGPVSAETTGLTFAQEPGQLYVPAKEAAEELHWDWKEKETDGSIQLNGFVIPSRRGRFLHGGGMLFSTGDLARAGAAVTLDQNTGVAWAVSAGHYLRIVPGAKRVEIDLTGQRLRAWQGKFLVLETRISSGRGRSTPTGKFTAGPYKAQSHFSRKYDNAPMPWSVQVKGNIFIHGFSSVPDYPASHGCIRLPLDGDNPAKRFYEWIDRGTPITILRK